MMTEGTQRLLAAATKLGIQAVGIGMAHPLVGGETFPWPTSSLFVPNTVRYRGWPAAWELAERAGVYRGVGNSGQAAIDTKGLIAPSVWQMQADGWIRIA